MRTSIINGLSAIGVWLLLGGIASAQDAPEPGKIAFLKGDYAGAMAIWLPLAEDGDAHARFNVGLLHDEGLGVPRNPLEARRWWNMAAEQGLAVADHNIGLLELELAASETDEGDTGRAIHHLKRASDAGYLASSYTLGKIYELGVGVPADQDMSVQLVRRAAEGGHARAQYNMGKRYRDGTGVEQDSRLAAEWFRRAALAGHPGGQDHYARRLRDADGVEKNEILAMAMAILAARAGHEEARELANEMKVPLDLAQLDKAFALANAFIPQTSSGPAE